VAICGTGYGKGRICSCSRGPTVSLQRYASVLKRTAGSLSRAAKSPAAFNALRFSDNALPKLLSCCLSRWRIILPWSVFIYKRHPKSFQERITFFVCVGVGHKSDVHSVDLAHLIDGISGKMIFPSRLMCNYHDIKSLSFTPLKSRTRGSATFIKRSRNSYMRLHAGNPHTNSLVLSQFKIRNVFLGFCRHRLLTGDGRDFLNTTSINFLSATAAPMPCDTDFLNLRNLHNRLVLKFLFQAGYDFLQILFFQTCVPCYITL